MVPPAHLARLFPRLGQGEFEVTSPAVPFYNCIAWAAGEDGRWWWPDPFNYWPYGVPQIDTVEAFMKAFERQGYAACADATPEAGVEKVAIYVGVDGRVKHMARQLPNGQWTSKLGQCEDVRHESPEMVESTDYGHASHFMRRPLKPTAKRRESEVR